MFFQSLFNQIKKTITKKKVPIPLICQAIASDSVQRLQELLSSDHAINEMKDLDFSPLEIAQFLGKKKCLEILKTKDDYETIQYRAKNENFIKKWPQEYFSELFGFEYSSFLRFESFEHFSQVLHLCPYLVNTPLSFEVAELGKKYDQELKNGSLADVNVSWCNENIAYGLFAHANLKKGDFIGECTGLVKAIDKNSKHMSDYCFHYPSKFWSQNFHIVDSEKVANLLRFINHSDYPNLDPIYVVNRNIMHLIFIANKDIPKGTHLSYNYGVEYWTHRKKM